MNRRALVLVTALFVIVLDQISKLVVSTNLVLNESWYPLPFLKPIFGLTYIRNTGAAFGIFQDMNLFFTIVAIIVSTVILLYVRSTPPPDRLIAFTLGLQLGGALGNLIDRLRYGYVIDFLHLKYWAISNVADVSISLSVVLLGYHLIFRSHPENKVEPTTVPLPTPVASSENNADAANG